MRATSTMRSRSSGCRTGTTGSACTSRTSRTTSRRAGALDEEAYERGDLGVFSGPRRSHVPVGAFDRPLQPQPDVDRLVQSCLMEVDAKGNVVRYELHDGVIHSNARMTYTEVHAILTELAIRPSPRRYQSLVPLFETMRELFEILNRRRHRRGSIDFDLKEPEIVLDDAGLVEEIIAAERNVAHRIIEEFMLLANETVAQHLDDNDVPTLYRDPRRAGPAQGGGVRGVRDDARLQPRRAARARQAAAFSEARRADARHAGGEADRVPDAAHDAEGALRPVRTWGHFGLAAESYTHFTSPIRRYPDLVVHRTLRESRHGPHDRGAPGRADGRPAGDCAPHVGARAPRRRRRARAGAVEEGPLHGGQGRRRVRRLHHRRDRVRPVHRAGRTLRRGHGPRLDDGRRLLPVRRAGARPAGREHRAGCIRLGDKVSVQVVKVDMERRQVDLGLAEILDRVRASESNRGPRQSRISRASAAGRQRREA